MFNKLDEFLSRDFIDDYWEDEASLLAIEIMKTFDEKDWISLEKTINFKNLLWLERLADILSDFPTQRTILILLKLIELNHKDLQIKSLDSLNGILYNTNFYLNETQSIVISKHIENLHNLSKIELILTNSIIEKLKHPKLYAKIE